MSVTTYLPFSIFILPVSVSETETEILDPVENLQERFLLSTLVEAIDHISPREDCGKIKTVELTTHTECRKTWSQLVSNETLSKSNKKKSSRSIRRNRVRARSKEQGLKEQGIKEYEYSPNGNLEKCVDEAKASSPTVSISPVSISATVRLVKKWDAVDDFSPVDSYIYERDDRVLETLPTTPCRWTENFGKCPLKQGCPFLHDNVVKKTK